MPQILTHVAALLPLALLAWDYWQDRLIDLVREITTRTGKTALILLILSLACTPINILFGFKQVMRVRRALGLYAFMYASLHFLTFVGLDYGFDFDLLGQGILDQRYVLVGLYRNSGNSPLVCLWRNSAAFAAPGHNLYPLWRNSAESWRKRLGKNWKRLHRLVYLASILAIVHFVWLAKDNRVPLRYGAVVALLLIVRIPAIRKAVRNARHQLKTRYKNYTGGLT